MWRKEREGEMQSRNINVVVTQTSVTKKAWKPYGTLCGNSTTATGSADIVFALMTCTKDFLQFCNLNSS